MLEVNKGKSTAIKDHKTDKNGIMFDSEAATLFVGAVSDSIVHIRYTADGIKERNGYSFVTATELDPDGSMDLSMDAKYALIKLKNLTLQIKRSNSAITFMDADGNILLRPDEEYPFYVMYTYDKANAYKLAEKLKEKGVEVSEDRIIPVGATVGAHIGPYACAVAYIKK